MLHGFDISGFQGNTAPAADFVFVKATEGSGYTNGKFAAQYASAKSHAKVRGAYHFARPEESSGSSQADRLLAVAKAVPGEVLILDLEASKLNQAQTNAWAKAFGDRLRARAPGVTTIVYMGSGYASNGTGRDLSKHFDLWWYPVYPSAFSVIRRVLARAVHHAMRVAVPARPRGLVLSKVTHSWPSAFSPWLPSGITTGWKKPHIWQFTDNFGGLDANISTLTISQLAAGGPTPTPTPTEEPEMIERELKPGLDSKTEFLLPPGKVSMVVANADNTYTNTNVKATGVVQIRVAIRKSDGTWQSKTGTVGRGAADKSQPEFKLPLADTKSTFVSVTRVDGTGDEPIVVGAY